MSRSEKLLKQTPELELSLPQCLAEYLVLLFYEVGFCEQGNMGAKPLSWTEIFCWKELTQRDLNSWEITMLRDMSRAYVGSVSNTDKYAPKPYIEDLVIDKEKQEAVIEDFFEMMLAQQNSKDIIIED